MNVTEVHIRKWVWLCRIGQWASDDGKWSTSTIEDVSSYKQNIRKSKILFVRAIWRRSVDQPSAYNTEPEPEPEPDQHLAQNGFTCSNNNDNNNMCNRCCVLCAVRYTPLTIIFIY